MSTKKHPRLSNSELYQPPSAEEMIQLKETENLFQSSLFRMQVITINCFLRLNAFVVLIEEWEIYLNLLYSPPHKHACTYIWQSTVLSKQVHALFKHLCPVATWAQELFIVIKTY